LTRVSTLRNTASSRKWWNSRAFERSLERWSSLTHEAVSTQLAPPMRTSASTAGRRSVSWEKMICRLTPVEHDLFHGPNGQVHVDALLLGLVVVIIAIPERA